MTWEHNGYTWKSGWFLEEYPWDGDYGHYLKFSADGVTTKGYGAPGITIASNYSERHSDDSAWWDTSARRNRAGDNITFDFNEESIVITGLPDHPVLGVEALTQTLDNDVENIEWETTLYDDIITINVNSFYTSGERIDVQARAGNDIFYINGDVTPLLNCDQNSGVWASGGAGTDYLILAGSLDDWDIQISPDLEGFDIRPWGGGSCAYVMARDVEIVQGDDFTWTFGDRFPVMGTPDSRDVANSQAIKNNLNAPTKSTPSSSQGGTTVINNYITNNTTSVENNTSNTTNTNISNSGSGNISIGDIGAVNNTTTIDNSFTIQTTSINLSLAITGDSKKSEKVEGTDGDDLIADGRGKDKLIGGDGADQFYFSGEEPFKKKTVDEVIDFDASEGDAIVIADEVVGDLTEDPTLAIANSKKDLKQLSKDGYDLLYFEPKGDLYVDGNGDSKGFGKKSEGGMIADLPNDTILTESDVLIGV